MPAGITWSDTSTDDLYMKIYKSAGNTYAPFNSYDPSSIVQKIINNYSNNGGSLDYSDTSVDFTGTSVSYTFSVNTVLEGVKKCVELAPENWYWYIDYGTNLLHFHEKSVSPDHTFALEKDLIDAKFEKRIEEVVNTVYFSGGDTGGGVNFFKKYTNAESIAKYGLKAMKYSDQRVTVEATADNIANNIIANRSEPELRVVLEILDSNNNQGMGYDIESIKVGDVVAVRNITQQVGLSTWDVGRWDEAYFDFNLFNLSSLQMQVQRIEYTSDKAIVSASTIATDVNKRIEDINRNLEVVQTLANPVTPI